MYWMQGYIVYVCYGMFLCMLLQAEGQADDGGEGVVDLYLLGLRSLAGPWRGGHSTRTAVEMGLEVVNNRTDILPGYRLNMVWEDTKCNPGLGVNNMYKQLNRAPVKVMILGAACSGVSEATSHASHLWNIVQISYLSASPSLSDKSKFPLFFRISSPNQLVNPARIQMMQDFNWRRVATIHESTDLFSKVTDDLVLRLKENNISLITSEIFTDNPAQQVENLKRHDARIIVAAFYEDKAYKVFCEAYKQGMYGPKYVWMILAFYNDGWWGRHNEQINCTPEQLTLAVEGAIGTGSVYLSRKQTPGVGGLTPSVWMDTFTTRMREAGLPLHNSDSAAMAYDAIWAAALSLNNTMQHLKDTGSNSTLEDFDYERSDVSTAIYESLLQVEFQGIKGYIRFDANGDNEGSVKIQRIQGGERSIVGYYEPVEGLIEWLPQSPLVWQGGSPPADSTTHIERRIYVEWSTYIAMSLIAAFGIFLSVLFFIFNIIYRKERLIKMSSPRMNNVILAGCVLAYINVFLLQYSREEVLIMCKARAYTLMIGFSLAFGALFSKTWRVYAIFMNRTKKVIIRDEQLMLIVCVIVVIDIVCAVTREVFDPLTVTSRIIGVQEFDGGDLVVTNLVWECTSQYSTYFQGAIYTIKGLLLIFGAFLAMQTRKVKIAALNDSQYIGLCIYNVAVLSLLGVVLAFALTDQVDMAYIFISSLIIFGTTATQLIIFIPKILKFKSSQNQVEDTDTGADFGTTTKTMTTSLPQQEQHIQQLQEQLNVKTQQLTEAETTIEQLRNEVRSRVKGGLHWLW